MIVCEFEDGDKAKLRHVIIDAIVVKDSKILLVKRTKKLLEGGKWAVIGGFMNRDENIFQTVEREVFEETGWKIDNITLFRIKHWPDRRNEDRQNVGFTFFANAIKKEGNNDWESDDVKWFLLDELPLKEEIAFDHSEDIELYKKYLRDNFSLPLLTKI